MNHRRIGLTEKMVVYTLLLATPAMIWFGSYVWYSARQAIMDRTFQQLISVRVEKQQLLEQYFRSRIEAARRSISHGAAERPLVSDFTHIRQVPDSLNPFSQPPVTDGVLLSGSPIMPEERRAPVYLLIEDAAGSCWQLALDTIPLNQIMSNRNPYNGLGISGEAYLVGADTLMRTSSRFHPNAILRTLVATEGVVEALHGKTATGVYADYRGKEVLGSFSPFNHYGLRWVIAAEIDTGEALQPVTQLGRNILFMGIFTTLAIFTAVWLAARKITRPLVRLRDAAEKISSGDYAQRVINTATDETGELTDSFNQMAFRLNQQSEQLKAEQLIRAQATIDGQEQERQRLSREIHDSLGQNLLAVNMLLNQANKADSGEVAQFIKPAHEITRETIREVRAIINDLRPPALSELGLTHALQNLCREMEQSAGIETVCHCGQVSTTDLQSVYLYRVAQEALQNAVKHAGAQKVTVRLSTEGDWILLAITDNGKGLDARTAETSSGGLRNIRERIQILGGDFSIENSPQGGTTLTIKLIKSTS